MAITYTITVRVMAKPQDQGSLDVPSGVLSKSMKLTLADEVSDADILSEIQRAIKGLNNGINPQQELGLAEASG